MAIFSVIDTTASGDYFDDGMVKDAANWAIAEAALSAATTHILVGGGAGTVPVMTASTGTGSPVRATSPTLVTPLLGTPTSGTLTNCTGLPVAGGGTGAATLTDHGILLGSGTNAITPMTALAAGEIIYGVASSDPAALAAGATTTILVGGGAAAPVWTTATGSGAPVRATSPALVTPTVDHIAESTGDHGVVCDGVTLKDGGALVITGGSNTFNLTNGSAVVDIAAGATLNLDANLTVTVASTLTTELHVTAPATHIADAAAGFTIAGGTTSKTFTCAEELHVEAATHVNQDLTSDANPTFANLTITSFAGNWTNAGRTVADAGILTTADINGGTIDNSAIGGSTPAAGAFTTLKATTGAAAGNILISDADGDLTYLAAGATTKVLVGGGAAVPVWTEATGSGAPVRATSPTLVTPLLGTPTSGDLSNCTLATPPAIGETTPNSIRGKNKEIFFTATDTADAAECAGTVVSNYGMTDADMVLTLPAAAEGLSFVCVLPAVRARYFRLTSAGTDKIYLAGVVGTGPGYVGVASGYATGSSCSMFTFKASDGGYDWFCLPLFGTWVAG